MKSFSLYFSCLMIMLLAYECKKAKDECGGCPNGQTCVNGECQESASVHHLGGYLVTRPNSFVGVAQHPCLDTIIYWEDTTRTDDFRFGLHFVNTGTRNFSPTIFETNGSDKITFIVGGTPVCNIDSEPVYPSLIFATLAKDSVAFEIRLQDLVNDGYRDTVFVTLRRKQ